MKEKYCITIVTKILIVQFILSFIGLAVGCLWGLHMENEKWSQLIYTGIKIEDIDVGGKTREEARNEIQSQYIDHMLNKKMHITVNNNIYALDGSQIIKNCDIEKIIDEAVNYGKNLSMVKRHELIKTGCKMNYSLDITYSDDTVKAMAENIEKEINTNSVNNLVTAKNRNAVKVSVNTEKYKIDKEKLDKSIKENFKAGTNEDIYIKASIVKADTEIIQPKKNAANFCIASFSTSFKSSTAKRAKNIDICAKAIDGKILMPGEVFSFNDVVGERTKERGYMEAPIIVGNEVESGIGGGICQVASTLYNAILRTGIQNIERTHHSLPSSYVGLGLDATVHWEDIDFKFTNTLNYPIYIEARTQNKYLYINIYSDSNLSKRKYIIENNISNDNAYKVKVIRKTYENGALINSELISNDVYSHAASKLKKNNR